MQPSTNITSQIELQFIDFYHLATDIHILLISKSVSSKQCCQISVLSQENSLIFSYFIEVNPHLNLALNGS